MSAMFGAGGRLPGEELARDRRVALDDPELLDEREERPRERGRARARANESQLTCSRSARESASTEPKSGSRSESARSFVTSTSSIEATSRFEALPL
jgi:hypothetical protein